MLLFALYQIYVLQNIEALDKTTQYNTYYFDKILQLYRKKKFGEQTTQINI